jgi:hypothetical protein
LRFPVNDLVNFPERRELFLKELKPWFDTFKPQAMIAERFQTRGNGGPLIEYVAVMLGLLAGTYPRIKTKFITASTWKNAFKRRFFDLKLLYPNLLIQPHPFDAAMIGIYGLEFGLKRQLKYDPFKIVKSVENSSLVPLKVPRGTKRKPSANRGLSTKNKKAASSATRITFGLSAIKMPRCGSMRLRNWASVRVLNTSTPGCSSEVISITGIT